MNSYHQKIIEYYHGTEKAYKYGWGVEKNLAIHYGYWDDKVKSFSQSLQRMNEIMAEEAVISMGDRILDAGCGVGGSGIFLAKTLGCYTVGLTLSHRQKKRAEENALRYNVSERTEFHLMDYGHTTLDGETFDIVWGCESICYADNKEQFIKEAFRLLKPGGRLVMADFMVPHFDNNAHPLVRNWLDGWSVNYLETKERFGDFMENAGFQKIRFRDISDNIMNTVKLLGKMYYFGKLYQVYRFIFGLERTAVSIGNINASRWQYLSKKENLWIYGLFSATKPKFL
ncbi:methyltransferase domain-containing protein [bacterium]|nr:methyltransferase domain-containing protein [bacterium]NUN47192.1 methyltransferase domain-containing protein [bacterium]